MDLMSLWMLSRSDFDREGEVWQLVWTIASVSLDAANQKRVFAEGEIVRSIEWLGLLCDLYIIDL